MKRIKSFLVQLKFGDKSCQLNHGKKTCFRNSKFFKRIFKHVESS